MSERDCPLCGSELVEGVLASSDPAMSGDAYFACTACNWDSESGDVPEDFYA